MHFFRYLVHRKVANRRKNHAHQVTATLVGQRALIVTEELSIGNMTASAKGAVGNPGKNIKQKAGLNRAILDTAPGSFVNVLCVKAEGWMPGDLVGHATVSVVADVPELRACPQKSPVRTRASMWLRIRGDARSSRRSFDARRWA